MKTLKLGRKHFAGLGSGKRLGHNHTIIYHSNGKKTIVKKIKSKASLIIKVNSPKNFTEFDDATVFEGAENVKIHTSDLI